ncbi:iron chelate uptake ABC transporter family permease subunit [Reinekea marinisedimentorum]|uniref:Iron complex transport system permease protein n=1 Tax=Reinekea marinisedimentorum TaxID=230495 RepID=A0A4V2UJ77_9GAMM|nr:iron chelate uptake ABC transporter family permease subunit [Reinekea marinisedimentorum]TCS38980.1 iron complex transport system permease protein [Reinekea marinisedimentorum]
MRATLGLPVLLLLVALLIVASFMLGAVPIPLAEILKIGQADFAHSFTLYQYRLPRAVLAVLVGGMMALAGALVQGVIRNPLASPDVLGISNGAGLLAVCFITLFPQSSAGAIPLVALLGSAMAALLLWLLVGRYPSETRLALTGVALAAFFAACIDFVMLLNPQEINTALLWLTGSLWGRNWVQVQLLLPWLLLVPVALLLVKPLNLLALDEQNARSMGVNVPLVRFAALALAVCLSGAGVAVCGPVGFLGLIAPHVTRRLLGSRHQLLLPGSFLVGAILLLFADLVGRVIDPPIEIPAGIVTAILGAPYFLWLLFRIK